MAARTILGVFFSLVGLAFVGYAAYNFNALFFAEKMLTQADIPSYDSRVVLPLLLGFILLLDGSITLGLKRKVSLALHLLGNLALVWAVNLLYGNLAVPVLDVSPYQPVFYSVVTGMFLFVAGFIVNDIPHRKTRSRGISREPQKLAGQEGTPTVQPGAKEEHIREEHDRI